MVTAEVVALASSPLSRWSRRPSRQRGRPLSIEEKDLLFCARVGRRPLLLPSCLPMRAASQWKRKNLRASRQAASPPPASPPERRHPQTRQGARRRGRGGAGDVSGVDYCHAVVRVDMMTQVPQRRRRCDGGAARRRRRRDRRRDQCGGVPPPIPGSYGSSWRNALPTQSTPARTTTAFYVIARPRLNMPREGEGGRIGADYCYDPLPDDNTDSSDGGNGGDGGTTSPLRVPPSM